MGGNGHRAPGGLYALGRRRPGGPNWGEFVSRMDVLIGPLTPRVHSSRYPRPFFFFSTVALPAGLKRSDGGGSGRGMVRRSACTGPTPQHVSQSCPYSIQTVQLLSTGYLSPPPVTCDPRQKQSIFSVDTPPDIIN